MDIKFENEEVKRQIESRIKEMFSQLLVYLEISLPHEKGDSSDNEKRFNTIRSKILRSGNDTIRSLDDILRGIIMLKAGDYNIVTKDNDMTFSIVAKFDNNIVRKG